MEANRTLIIGAGIAGIATAIRQAVAGREVHVFEANSYPGGKLSRFELGSYRFDAGPSLFTMPHWVEELFELAGENPEEHFPYLKDDVACRYFWTDGTRLTAWADVARFAAEAEKQLGEPSSNVRNHLSRVQVQYDATAPLFLQSSLHRLKTYRWKHVKSAVRALPKLDLTRSMAQVHERAFKTEKMRQLFHRFATYNGSSPYQAPGVLAMIPHLEHGIGTFLPKNGMGDITDSLVKLAERLGVQFHYNAPVSRIQHQEGRVRGIELQDGTVWASSTVVSNMDVVPTYRKLMQDWPAPEPVLNQERSSSALIFYWGMQGSFPELGLHNIFFSDDYPGEFRALFEEKLPGSDPTVYVNITSKLAQQEAPEGCENWFVMVNAPADYGQDWEVLRQETRKKVLDKLSSTLNRDLAALIETETFLDPPGIERATSSYRGALYGAASNNRLAAFLRHPNKGNGPKGLYHVGGSVHPGGGIPLCLMSAKITNEWIVDQS